MYSDTFCSLWSTLIFPLHIWKKKTEGKRYIYFPKYASLRSDNLGTQIQVCVSSRHTCFSTPPVAFHHSKHLLEIILNFKSKLSNEFVNESFKTVRSTENAYLRKLHVSWYCCTLYKNTIKTLKTKLERINLFPSLHTYILHTHTHTQIHTCARLHTHWHTHRDRHIHTQSSLAKSSALFSSGRHTWLEFLKISYTSPGVQICLSKKVHHLFHEYISMTVIFLMYFHFHLKVNAWWFQIALICQNKSLKINLLDFSGGALRIHLLMQGTQARSLIWEDSRCLRQLKPVRHSWWAPALEPSTHKPQLLSPHAATAEARMLQLLKPACLEPWASKQEKPLQWEACVLQWRVAISPN